MIPGKAAGPSRVVSEMIKASGGAGIELIRDLINAIIAQNCIPSAWQYSYIVNLYKGKGDALVRGNYRGLKLMDHLMKTVERVVEALRRNMNIDEMQCGFMSGRLPYASCKRSTWLPTNHFSWPLLTWKRHLIVFFGR